MNIGVVARLLDGGNMTGIGWFLFESMRRIAEAHPEHNFYYIFDHKPEERFATSHNIVPVRVPFRCRYRPVFYRLWYDVALPLVVRRHKIQMLVCADGAMSLAVKVPTLLVIHDLAFEHYPEYIPPHMSRFLRRYTPQWARRAAGLATVSEYSREDISSLYNISSDRITVTYNGSHNLYAPLQTELCESVKREFADGSDYFLFVGTIHPRKNLANQLLAFDKFRSSTPEATHKFIVVGRRWIWDEALELTYANMRYRDQVVFLGHLGTDSLARLTSAATALMYVSVFEGFGIPIIEAFEAQTPVITSATSSMPEVAGDAALVVDPFDSDAIAAAMRTVATDAAARNVLVERGAERRKLFSWDRTAAALNARFEQVVELARL